MGRMKHLAVLSCELVPLKTGHEGGGDGGEDVVGGAGGGGGGSD